jgi:gluconate 2-dehydrogenase gamma chain
MRSDTLRRRRFLQIAASAASAAAVSCGGRGSPWRVLTAQEGETANAICDRIIPADQDPGAAAAGAVNYIDRQLNGPLRKYRRAYRDGLLGIDQASQAQFGRRFAALKLDERDRLLAAIDAGKAPGGAWAPAEAKLFFDLIRDHTLQGFYGDPRHGGNREYASWLMLGVPPAPVRGRLQYDLTGKGPASRKRSSQWRSNA